MSPLLLMIEGIQEVLAVCPCCGDVFRLAEAKFLFPDKSSRPSEYLDLHRAEQRAALDQERLGKARERFDDKLDEVRKSLCLKGEKRAKRRLKKIDPTFSGRNVSPDDVKVIFDPVEFIVFHGMCEEDIRMVEFVSRAPRTSAKERVVASIDRVLSKCDVTFETLRLRDDGTFAIDPD